MKKAQDKRIELGEKLYEEFVERVADAFLTSDHVSNPITGTLEMFALLEKKGMPDLLFVEMMKEYLSNFLEVKLSVEKGKLFHHFETKTAV